MTEIQECVEDYENSIKNTQLHNTLGANSVNVIDNVLFSLMKQNDKPKKTAFYIAHILEQINQNQQLKLFKLFKDDADFLIHQRIVELVENNKIKANGNIKAIRFSEIYL